MDTQSSKQYLYGKKHAENVRQKLVSDSFGKEPKKQAMHKTFFKISYFKSGLSKNV